MTKPKFGIDQERFYRLWMKKDDLVSFQASAEETDLYIRACSDLKPAALDSIRRHRRPLEEFIRLHPEFEKTLTPYPLSRGMAPIIRDMVSAAKKVGVGPMAAVAGAVADYVGRDLLKKSREVIIENGGDIFLKVSRPVKIGIYAADSPFTNRLSFEISPEQTPLGVCTSSGTVGPSLSFGSSDATVILARTAAFADACATAVGNLVKDEDSVDGAVAYARKIRGLYGVIVVKGKKLGVWGKVRFVV
jgi:ApbE superfamily uncharacterized protein (UPF0280 family)